MNKINIQFTLFSAFYSPVISTMTGGFLEEEGLEYSWSVAKPGTSALEALEDGSAHVVQSALSQGFKPLNNKKEPECVHFAQVNEMDGFFLTGRNSEPEFKWENLTGAEVLVHHGEQPMAMFKYACHQANINIDDINIIDAGNASQMDVAFRDGKGMYIHQQGPAPQQLEADGIGYVVTKLGPLIGPCGFSSLAAKRDWLNTDMAAAFMRAYRKTRLYLNETPAYEIALAETKLFPTTDIMVLADCIGTYQKLGCWTPHINITRPAYEATLDIFEYNNLIKTRHPYDMVCFDTK
ncbi:MAG: hypothetical protein O3A15_02545 [Proteobacteria bacterium]|jgi:NitT/TauT family transport system substrate-binding protein|nr:hypothetical protein [Pseudomonadota bacterium]